MSWTRPIELRNQVQRLWERGDLLASLVTGEEIFPRQLTLKGPGSQEMTERFDAVRVWIAELRAMPHCRVEMREFRHRLFGANAVPHAVWIDSFDDALALIGKRRDAMRFKALLECTRTRAPQVLAWLVKRPLRALELADEWPRLLDIVTWLQAHPRPGIYLRQVDIPGVHSKFIVLDQLRAHFPQVESFLMDRATLLAFEAQWGKEDQQTLRDLPRLNPDEQALYDDLRDNRLRRNLRLEQERIGFGWVEVALAALAGLQSAQQAESRL